MTHENGLVRSVYPFSTEKFSAQPLENVMVNVLVRSTVPVRTVYSPSHPVAVYRQDEYRSDDYFVFLRSRPEIVSGHWVIFARMPNDYAGRL